MYYPMDVDDVPAAGGLPARPAHGGQAAGAGPAARRGGDHPRTEVDAPVPLMEQQPLVDAFAPHDIQVPEQVIEVPKILIDELPMRTPSRESQLAEQLVEAPSIVSLIEVIRQPVDIPGQRGGVRLQGCPPEQGSTASSSSSHVPAGAVDEPVPRGKKSAKMGPRSGSELGATLFHPR